MIGNGLDFGVHPSVRWRSRWCSARAHEPKNPQRIRLGRGECRSPASVQMMLYVLVLALVSNAQSSRDLECLSWWRWDTPDLCRARGCRVDDLLNCVYPVPSKVSLKRIHVVQGCHFDAGFVAPDPMIINRWWHEFFPLAYKVGSTLAASNNGTSGPQLHFTAQSWLVQMFLNCPPEYQARGVVCPSSTAISQFREAVKKGFITWHAFPFNGQAEIFDASMFSFGFEMTHQLDDILNVSRKKVLSQRDVPGMTRAAIPIMSSNGIAAISVGTNDGSAPVNVPKSFLWRFNSSLSVRAFWLGGGYGGVATFPYPVSLTEVPGAEDALVFQWRGDNAGPPTSAQEVIDDWKSLQKAFPDAEIIASTFDDFVNAVALVPDENFPVIDAEIGDTWIYGVASDPLKVRDFRIFNRLRSACLESGLCSTEDARIFDASVLALKNGEHTWGRDQKVNLGKYVSKGWSNNEFATLKFTPKFLNYSASWIQQREMGINDAITALGNHSLAQEIRSAIAEASSPLEVNTSGWKPLVADSVITIGGAHTLVFGANGALIAMNNVSGFEFGLLTYSTYDTSDYDKFEREYNYLWPVREVNKLDFDKVNLPDGTKHMDVAVELIEGFVGPNAVLLRFQTPLALDLVADAGACPVYTVLYDLSAQGTLTATVLIANKTATRLPESTSLAFRAPSSCLWSMKKLGSSVSMDPRQVQVGGSRHLHVVDQISCGSSLTVSPIDAPLVSFGTPSAFPVSLTKEPDLSSAAHFILHDNLWNTNYVMWYPYQNIGQDLKLRFEIGADPIGAGQ